MWKILFKPKIAMAVGSLFGVLVLGLYIQGKIRDYGKTQYQAGKTECERALRKKIADIKRELDAVNLAARQEAEKTHTLYVTATKTIDATDNKLIAENVALKQKIEDLQKRITNAKPDRSVCAGSALPAASLSIHTDINRLLQGH